MSYFTHSCINGRVRLSCVLFVLSGLFFLFFLSYGRYTLPESAPVGTTVLSVMAQDSDSGIYGQFRYYVENPFFAVNLFTGEITTTKPLDYETASSHTFVVLAQDGGSPASNGTAWVEVTVTNVNDNPPRFTQTIYNEYVTEDAGPGELVTTGESQELDQFRRNCPPTPPLS